VMAKQAATAPAAAGSDGAGQNSKQ
jgi:hypothetical protein